MKASSTPPATVDKAVRDYILSIGSEPIELQQLRSDVEKTVKQHPGVESVQITPRGKNGACLMKVYSSLGMVAVVTVYASGVVDAVPCEPPLAAAHAARVQTPDERAAHLGTEAAGNGYQPLSQNISPKEAAQTRHALVKIIDDAVTARTFCPAPVGANNRLAELTPKALGFVNEHAMRKYVQGGYALSTPESKAAVKRLRQLICSHQMWARKCVAAAYGVMLQARETKKR